jgi:uncharacterized protein YjbI with pentapeptide repeats
MAQSIWYIRHEDKVFGPFPPQQIEEALKSGEINPESEVSLNAVDWLSIADSGQFDIPVHPEIIDVSEDSVSWHDQRRQARKRWLHEGASVTEVARDPVQDAADRSSVERNHIRTQALVNEAKNKRRSPWIFMLALALIAVAGFTIWLGQGDKPIQAGISQIVNCTEPLRDGVNWTGCVNPGYVQPNAKARNALLNKVRLDDARLKGADLSYASLQAASLRNVELVGVNLTGADLSQADLSGADLSGADLRYAVLTKANLTGVRFAATRLDKATWVDGRVCAAGSTDVCR